MPKQYTKFWAKILESFLDISKICYKVERMRSKMVDKFFICSNLNYFSKSNRPCDGDNLLGGRTSGPILVQFSVFQLPMFCTLC